MQNEDLTALSDADLQRRLDAANARLELMDTQLEDIRDEGRDGTPVYERIQARRATLDAEVQRLTAETLRRPQS